MKTQQKILQLPDLLKLRNQWKSDNKKVVFTNGCFDLLHLGHVDYLEKAAALGDKLIVGINTDQSVSDIKGPARPITDEHSRSRLMAALEFVDAVVLFGEETPIQLISALLPDVLVKGNDYSIETIVGAKEVIENGGTVQTVDLVDGYSTSKIVDKIKNE